MLEKNMQAIIRRIRDAVANLGGDGGGGTDGIERDCKMIFFSQKIGLQVYIHGDKISG